MPEEVFVRADRRRWDRENWPRWERMLRHKKAKWQWVVRDFSGFWVLSEPRTNAELVEVCDQMLRDLGEDPEVE